jgi:peptide subunit release factor RF-3
MSAAGSRTPTAPSSSLHDQAARRIARDLDGDPVFLAENAFSLNYEAERWKMIEMVAIKEYHVAKAA